MAKSTYDNLLRLTEAGLYCPAGDFYIDPWRPVRHAIVTHAHSDHACPGSQHYLSAASNQWLMRMRLGADIDLQCVEHGHCTYHNGVKVSLHPAGHMLGASQVRLECNGQVAVVTGDYKLRGEDRTCPEWEAVPCDLLVTESTFGLPAFRWPHSTTVFQAIHDWWRDNQAAGRCSILFAYAIGKSQRLLTGVDPSIGPIFVHGAVHRGNQAYRRSGIDLPECPTVSAAAKETPWNQALVVAVPSAAGTPWLRRFGDLSTAIASGWMQVRGVRRRRNVDRGFVLSDHVDWPTLLEAIHACQPQEVWVTHGFSDIVSRYLNEIGITARSIETRFRGETLDSPDPEEERDDREASPAVVAAEPPSGEPN